MTIEVESRKRPKEGAIGIMSNIIVPGPWSCDGVGKSNNLKSKGKGHGESPTGKKR